MKIQKDRDFEWLRIEECFDFCSEAITIRTMLLLPTFGQPTNTTIGISIDRTGTLLSSLATLARSTKHSLLSSHTISISLIVSFLIQGSGLRAQGLGPRASQVSEFSSSLRISSSHLSGQFALCFAQIFLYKTSDFRGLVFAPDGLRHVPVKRVCPCLGPFGSACGCGLPQIFDLAKYFFERWVPEQSRVWI
jgi:hypothetical protein